METKRQELEARIANAKAVIRASARELRDMRQPMSGEPTEVMLENRIRAAQNELAAAERELVELDAADDDGIVTCDTCGETFRPCLARAARVEGGGYRCQACARNAAHAGRGTIRELAGYGAKAEQPRPSCDTCQVWRNIQTGKYWNYGCHKCEYTPIEEATNGR